MSDLAAQLELSRNLYDELFSQTKQLRAELQRAQRRQDTYRDVLVRCSEAIDALDRAYEALLWISEHPNREVVFSEDAEALAQFARALVKLGEQP